MPKLGADGVNLDALKRDLAIATVEAFPLELIRQHSLANLDRWNICSIVYEEWQQILLNETDEELRNTMTMESERSVRLRQSYPWVGLLPADIVRAIKAAHVTSS